MKRVTGGRGGRWCAGWLAWAAIVCGQVALAADPPVADGAASAATTAASLPAYWQVPPLPTAVIQGGAIPPGWQPQAVPYQGVGPDGRPVTMYFAPTYVFTYQSGPPVPAVPQVNRGRWSPQPAAVAVPSGWNYATTGASPVPTTLAPGPVTRYRPAYQFPDNARALQGSAVVPPGPLPAAAAPPPADTWGSAGPSVPSTLAPPPSQWVPAAPQGPSAAPAALPLGIDAAAAGAAAVAMQPTPAPVATPAPPPPAPAPALQPLAPPGAPPAVPVASRSWRVVGVYDGDTVTCLDESGQQQKVRLAGIDAPATSQEYGPQARDALAGMVFGRTVEVIGTGQDANGAWLARLAVDGQDVNRQLVATGNAWADPAAADPTLAAVQATAQSQGIGLWAQPNPTAPWSQR